MDAHLFNLLGQALLPALIGARIEKIQEPAPELLVLSFFSQGKKRALALRHGRANPFLGLISLRLPSPRMPSAPIMRIRKYFDGRRIASAIADCASRCLWLLASATENGKAVWLRLDFVKGPGLFFLDPGAAPEEAPLKWPAPEELEGAMATWREWTALTPALRKTLAALEPPERAALLLDLEAGGGDVFLYKANGEVAKASAWPLPESARQGLVEEARDDILEAFLEAGNGLIAGSFFKAGIKEANARSAKKRARLERLLANLDRDEAELGQRLGREKEALAIQASLWRWPREAKTARLDFCHDGHDWSISLDPLRTVRENMERMFKKARGAKGGLEILRSRREALLAELAAEPGPEETHEGGNECQAGASQALASARTLPKNVQAFISSDGYLIIRGKNAAGNRALRKLAAPHDLWAHVETGPGAHVVIRNARPGKDVPERTLEEAGGLAAAKSWLSGSDRASVMYAELRHVRPIRGGAPGNVSIDRLAFTRSVALVPGLEERLAPRLA